LDSSAFHCMSSYLSISHILSVECLVVVILLELQSKNEALGTLPSELPCLVIQLVHFVPTNCISVKVSIDFRDSRIDSNLSSSSIEHNFHHNAVATRAIPKGCVLPLLPRPSIDSRCRFSSAFLHPHPRSCHNPRRPSTETCIRRLEGPR
jgi:hypothetical protein